MVSSLEYQSQRAHIETLLAQGAVSQAMIRIEKLYADSSVDPDIAHWLIKQAHGWHTNGFLEEQRRICELVLAALPNNFEALHLLGFHAQLAGRYDQAEEYYSKALAAQPDYAFSKLAHAQLRMMQTNFREGREGYEARFNAVTEAIGPDWRGLPIMRWRGESVAGKHIYLWAEQGLGDIIMFAAFLPYLLKQSPRRLVVAMFPKLITLFARSFPGLVIEPLDDAANHALAPAMQHAFPQIEKLAEHASVPFSLEPLRASYEYVRENGLFDVAAPMGDMLVHCLPQFIPAAHQESYLVADPERVATMRNKLEELGQGRLIGVSWLTQNIRETTRNIPLEKWLPLLAVPGCHFVSLQHGVVEAETERFCVENGCRITIYPEVNLTQDAEGLVALIATMDEVITIDNSNVHIAGALGVKTTLLLPKGSNFRWPERADNGTIWYKSVTTLRQKTLFDWQPVMAQVEKQLLKKR